MGSNARSAITASCNEKTGSFELKFNGKASVATLSPVLYYDGEWLAEQTGEVVFTGVRKARGGHFEGNPLLPGEHEAITKIFAVTRGDARFEVHLHAVTFPSLDCVYFHGSIAGAGPRFDKIVGYIDLGVPGNVRGYRYFHGSEAKDTSTGGDGTAVDFFICHQNSFHDSAASPVLPDNDRLRITYLLADLERGKDGKPACAALVPVNRWGQRTLIRCCSILGLPHGAKLVSGTHVDGDTYENMAGGILAFGDDPVVLSTRVFETYMQLIGRQHALRWYKEFPVMFEYIGFCTWNTFVQRVSHALMEELCKANFTATSGSTRFKYLIMDDGWQSTSAYPFDGPADPAINFRGKNFLQRFEANHKFPGGLEAINRLLREQYGFRWWGVWHEVTGYWQGIAKNSPLLREYHFVTNMGHITPDPRDAKGYKFWIDYYAYMRRAGVDMVKIDNQSSLGRILDGVGPVDALIEAYYLMQQGAAAAHNITILNCMAQASDCKIHWTRSNVARITGDFAPGDVHVMKKQVRQGIYQALFFAQFCWPDDDMFYTTGECKPLALLHMVSGGPVYVTDEVGKTDGKMVARMCFEDGRVPRLDVPAMPTVDCIFEDSDRSAPVKAWSYHDLDGWGRVYYYLVMNDTVDGHPVEASIGLDDMGAARFLPTPEGSKAPPAKRWPEAYVLADITDVPAPAGARVEVLEPGRRSTPIPLGDAEARYHVLSPVVHGISILGVDEAWNGTKALASATWQGQATLVLCPAYAGTLRFFAMPGVEVTATDAAGTPLRVLDAVPAGGDGSRGTVYRLAVGKIPITLRIK